MFFSRLFNRKKMGNSDKATDDHVKQTVAWDEIAIEEKQRLIQWAIPIAQEFGGIMEKATRMFESKEILNDSYENIRVALCIAGMYTLIQNDNKMFDNCMCAVVTLSNFVDATEEEIDSLPINNLEKLVATNHDDVSIAENMVNSADFFEKLQQQQTTQLVENATFVNAFFGKKILNAG